MAERKLVIDVEVKKKTTGSSGRETENDDSKARNERQKQADKEAFENLKASNKLKQTEREAALNRTKAMLDTANAYELEAERQGNREKIKEMIAFRKIMETQLRLMEADNRLANSKDLADYKANLKEKDKAQKEYDRSVRNAPKTKLKGDIGSLAYVRQIESSMAGMTAGTQEYAQTEAILNRYKAKLTELGVDVRSFSQKIGDDVANAMKKQAAGIDMPVLSFKALNTEIKAVKTELIKLQATGQEGSEQWKLYSKRLEELTLQKRIVQKQAKLTSERMLEVSGNLSMVGMNVRGVVQDLSTLTQGGQSVGELTGTIASLGIGVVATIPAIQALQKSIAALTLTTSAGVGMFGTAAAGAAAVGTAYSIMIGHIVHAKDEFDRIGKVLSGQMSYWEAIKTNLKDVTFGLIDFTDASNNFDSENVQQQLSDLAYIANFTSNAFQNLKQSVNDALTVNAQKFLDYATKNNLPESYAGPEPKDGHKPGYYDDKGTWHDGVKPNTNRGGKTKSVKEKEEELNLVKLQEQELKKLQLQLEKNKGEVGAELELKKKILEVEREIHRLKFGDPVSAVSYKIFDRAEQGTGISKRSGNTGKDAGIDEAKRIQEIYNQIADKQLSAFNQSFSLVQQIDQVLGGGAAEVINAFQTAYSITQAIVELINTINSIFDLISLIPGGGAIAAIARADGGDVEKGLMYQWNENGKELFIPTGNGYVLNPKEFSEFSSAIAASSSAMARDNTYVNMYQGKISNTPQVLIKNIIKNPIDFKKAFELTSAEMGKLYGSDGASG